MQEDRIIRRFDNLFGTESKDLYLQKKPILTAIFKGLGENLYIQDESYVRLRRQKIEIERELLQQFSEEDESLYTKFSNIDNQMSAKREMQLFLFGFLVATHINKEIGK